VTDDGGGDDAGVAMGSRRLADVEYYVTTENRSLAREIEELR